MLFQKDGGADELHRESVEPVACPVNQSDRSASCRFLNHAGSHCRRQHRCSRHDSSSRGHEEARDDALRERSIQQSERLIGGHRRSRRISCVRIGRRVSGRVVTARLGHLGNLPSVPSFPFGAGQCATAAAAFASSGTPTSGAYTLTSTTPVAASPAAYAHAIATSTANTAVAAAAASSFYGLSLGFSRRFSSRVATGWG
mmetsp:Transcript_16407/g.40374  ORF Transcript_16407/g.40374 Transcript_16407/m.40374 type:complete len:200 (+) Transcript_16407:219-818(+)